MLIKKIHIFSMLVLMLIFTNKGLPQQADTVVKSIKISAKQKSVQKDSSKKVLKKSKPKLKGFVDKNANGVDDRLEKTNAMKKKGKTKHRRDVFIDKNGDGICDGRESAIGLKKTQHRRRGPRK